MKIYIGFPCTNFSKYLICLKYRRIIISMLHVSINAYLLAMNLVNKRLVY